MAKRWTLGAPAWNRRTRHFYKKVGFVKAGKDGPDGIRFERKMPESSVEMNLRNLTEEHIEQLAQKSCDFCYIFARGVDYSRSGRVIKLEYGPDGDRIAAEVNGSYGNYVVKISATKHGIDAYCDCPYEAYPCKHIVAVLLSSANEREQ